MTMINQKMASLLDKLYNLRGENSVVFRAMEEEKSLAEETRTRTTITKGELETKLDNLNNEEKELSIQGEKFRSILGAFGNDDYSNVINKLGIDFNPAEIMNAFDSNLPDAVNKIVAEKETTREELNKTSEELNDSITKLEELNIRKAELVANQERLNRYFDLALNSNINITRDEITMLLEKIGFDEQEQRTAAKILMFPEDGLFEYEKLREENPGVENIVDVLKGSKRKDDTEKEEVEEEISEAEPVEEIPEVVPAMPELPENPEETEEEPVLEEEEPVSEMEETPVEDIKVETMEVPENDPIIDFTVPTVEPVKAKEEKPKKEVEVETAEVPVVEETKEPEVVKEEVKENSKEDLTTLLNSLGLDYLDYGSGVFDTLLANMNNDLFTDNVKLVEALGMNKDIFKEHSELLYDKDLQNKITKLTEVGKLPNDIYLNPSILTKYNYDELQSAINVLVESGLEPKKVPLIAY